MEVDRAEVRREVGDAGAAECRGEEVAVHQFVVAHVGEEPQSPTALIPAYGVAITIE